MAWVGPCEPEVRAAAAPMSYRFFFRLNGMKIRVQFGISFLFGGDEQITDGELRSPFLHAAVQRGRVGTPAPSRTLHPLN